MPLQFHTNHIDSFSRSLNINFFFIALIHNLFSLCIHCHWVKGGQMNLSFHVVDFIRQFLLYFWDGAISIISFWLVLLLCRWLK